MKVAIVYDRVNKWGGAERVLLALHELFPDAPLYTSLYNSQKASWAKVFPEVRTSFLQKMSFLRNKHELLAPIMPLAFEVVDFSGFDLVISVTSEAAKGIITRPPTKHICYCLTPTRYLWSHYNQYFKKSFIKSIAKPVVSYLRTWDKIAAQGPDKMIAISNCVKDRVKKYYGRESEVVYPPVGLIRPRPAILQGEALRKVKKRYFLIVSRLVPYKRVDLAVEAFNKLGYPLVIIGTGSQESKLKAKSEKNIKFVGFASDEKLVGYYEEAKALIIPQEEDFGIVAVEAQAFGCPVIAYNKGGVRETVINGVTGIFFKEQTVDNLVTAVKRFGRIKFNTDDLVTNAKRFSKSEFKKSFLKIIKKI